MSVLDWFNNLIGKKPVPTKSVIAEAATTLSLSLQRVGDKTTITLRASTPYRYHQFTGEPVYVTGILDIASSEALDKMLDDLFYGHAEPLRITMQKAYAEAVQASVHNGEI